VNDAVDQWRRRLSTCVDAEPKADILNITWRPVNFSRKIYRYFNAFMKFQTQHY